MIKHAYFIMLISYTFFSCGNASNKSNADQNETTPNTGMHDEHEEGHLHHNETDDNTIMLDDGKKWVVDAPMMENIKAMEDELSKFNGKTDADYNKLSKSLQTHLDELTSKCTMKGLAHDELHKWLLPFIDLVNAFAQSTDMQVRDSQLKEINTSLEVFHHYFE